MYLGEKKKKKKDAFKKDSYDCLAQHRRFMVEHHKGSFYWLVAKKERKEDALAGSRPLCKLPTLFKRLRHVSDDYLADHFLLLTQAQSVCGFIV